MKMLPCHWCLLLSEWRTLGSFEMCSTSFWMQTKVSDFLLVVRQWSAQAKEVVLVLFFAYDVDAIEFPVTWRWIWLWSDSIILMSIDFHFHSRWYDMPKFAFHQGLIIQASIIKDRNNCIQVYKCIKDQHLNGVYRLNISLPHLILKGEGYQFSGWRSCCAERPFFPSFIFNFVFFI